MALERVPADIRKDGGIARMSDPKVIHCLLFLLKHALEPKRSLLEKGLIR